MHRYFIKTPWIARRVFPDYVWRLPAEGQKVYLTFDDGPHPEITPWVLDLLKAYDAKASFFCIGNNVVKYPAIYERIIAEGHATGNHTYDHLNGWKTDTDVYIRNVSKAAHYIASSLFRPPYGRIRSKQAAAIGEAMQVKTHIIMWDVLSGDFDASFSGEQCFLNVAKHMEPGSIIVFHDSEKAFRNLEFALPAVLDYMQREGFTSEKISL